MDTLSTEPLVINPPDATTEASRRPHLSIRPPKGWVAMDLMELWKFRDLLFALAGRDLKLRYKQTALGVIWVVLQPILPAIIMSFVFGTVAGMKTSFLFCYVGQMAWNLFNGVLTKAGGSLVGNAHLISKVFFPRLILPLSSLPSALVDFGMSLAVLAVIMIMNHVAVSVSLLLLPIWIAILLLFATGIGLIATSLMVTYRDVAYVLPVVLNALYFASPVAYGSWNVPPHARFWYDLNPLAAIFEAIHWSILGEGSLNVISLGISLVASIATLFFGIFAFKRMEQKFADVI